MENYVDMHYHTRVGLYESCPSREYVPYIRPQEHGNHTGTKMLQIGGMTVTADDPFEFCVSRYSSENLTVAEHTDELRESEDLHVRVDYRVSGVGSHSCGPELQDKYKMMDKEFRFSFRWI